MIEDIFSQVNTLFCTYSTHDVVNLLLLIGIDRNGIGPSLDEVFNHLDIIRDKYKINFIVIFIHNTLDVLLLHIGQAFHVVYHDHFLEDNIISTEGDQFVGVVCPVYIFHKIQFVDVLPFLSYFYRWEFHRVVCVNDYVC